MNRAGPLIKTIFWVSPQMQMKCPDHIWLKRKKEGEDGPYNLLLISRNSFLMRVRGFVERYVCRYGEGIRTNFFIMIERVKHHSNSWDVV